MRVAPDSLLPGRAFLYAFAQQDEETDPELGETQIPVSDLLLTSHTAQGTSENLSPKFPHLKETIYLFLSADLSANYRSLDTAQQNREPGFKSWI